MVSGMKMNYKMGYNIVKIMTDSKGKKTHVLLNDGLAQIWEIKTKTEAERITKVLTENSDSGWEYILRESCTRK
jgi:hypothetical protein